MPAAPVVTQDAPPLTEVVAAGLKLARDAGHPGVVDQLEMASARLARQEVLVAVLGEFKQGKSSLINGLLGEAILTVDDDLATAVPAVIRFGPVRSLRARSSGDEAVIEELPFDALTEVGSELGARSSREGIESLEIALPNRFLEHGLVLVDTPGFGSLRAGYDDMTLGALRVADGVLFVTDASAPLSSAEVAFLGRAQALAAAVVLVVTKCDLYGEADRIMQTNEAILAAKGIRLPALAVSSSLRMQAFEARDAELNAMSGYPGLLTQIQESMLAGSGEIAAARARREATAALDSMTVSLSAEIAALRDPASAGESLQELLAAQTALEKLRGPGARWSQVISDGYADLVSEVDFHFRSALREALRISEERIEQTDPKHSWDDMTGEFRAALGSAVGTITTELEEGSAAVDAKAAEVLSAEHVDGAGISERERVNVESLWRAKLTESAAVKQLGGTAYSGMRGAQGGIIMIGLVTNLAGLALTTGATLGIGAIFGGKQILDERRRQVTARRQQARTAIRQFADDVQFEASKALRDLGRDLQRSARDRFSAHIAATQAELAATMERVRAAATAEDAVRKRDLAAADQRMAVAHELLRLLAGQDM